MLFIEYLVQIGYFDWYQKENFEYKKFSEVFIEPEYKLGEVSFGI